MLVLFLKYQIVGVEHAVEHKSPGLGKSLGWMGLGILMGVGDIEQGGCV